MKRGLITWDKTEIPPGVFERRISHVRDVLEQRKLSALAVYSDLWRSNQARFFSNFMPYFNRALLIIPRDTPLILLCGLSPRVYGWIRSVTTVEDVRSAGNFAKPLFEIAAERTWRRIGLLDSERFPYDIYQALQGGPLEMINVESAAVFRPAADPTEMAIRRRVALEAEAIVVEEMSRAVGLVDYEFVGRLELRFRRAGAEDLIVLLTNGEAPPAPASGVTLNKGFSVSIAAEYRGHWVRLSRADGAGITGVPALLERLDSPYAYECGTGEIMAGHLEVIRDGKRLFWGDTNL